MASESGTNVLANTSKTAVSTQLYPVTLSVPLMSQAKTSAERMTRIWQLCHFISIDYCLKRQSAQKIRAMQLVLEHA